MSYRTRYYSRSEVGRVAALLKRDHKLDFTLDELADQVSGERDGAYGSNLERKLVERIGFEATVTLLESV